MLEGKMAIKRGSAFAIGGAGWRTCSLPGNSSTERTTVSEETSIRDTQLLVHSALKLRGEWQLRVRISLPKSIYISLCVSDVKH